jgi:excisionase family DNA binding protein
MPARGKSLDFKKPLHVLFTETDRKLLPVCPSNTGRSPFGRNRVSLIIIIMNSSIEQLERASQSLLGFFEGFKLDLIAEVKEVMQKEILSARADEKSEEQVLTRQEAAKLLDCSLTTLCHYQKEGVIPFYKVGKKVLFKRKEILDSIRKQVKKGGRHEK